jgi:glycosyltransferase involved in cell wall biosynthesis
LTEIRSSAAAFSNGLDHRLKFSIVIPYKRRLETIAVVFAALADQTMDSSQFEVIVGAMEYSHEYVALCREFTDRLSLVSVMTAADWYSGRATNLAIRHASGQVLLVLDADMALPTRFLENLYNRYFAHNQNICVLGQMVGYDDVGNQDLDAAEVLPYSHYRTVLADLEANGSVVLDSRWSVARSSAFARFPWASVRTALTALPAATVREHDLLIDEGFHGWGPEDKEWGFRIAATGTPIVLGQDVYGVHLPHRRDVKANGAEAWANNRYYLAKWPRLGLELALGFGGWVEADRIYPDVESELADAVADASHTLGVARGMVSGRNILVVGAVIDARSRGCVPELNSFFGGRSPLDVLPLVGFSLPYDDKSIDECRILRPIPRLSKRYRDAVFREAERVSRKVVPPAGGERR